jgi:hypothetical protein
MANPTPSSNSNAQKSMWTPHRSGKYMILPTVDALISRAQDRSIPRDATVRVSPVNPELQRNGRLEEVRRNLEAAGVKLVVDAAVGQTEVRVETPKR